MKKFFKKILYLKPLKPTKYKKKKNSDIVTKTAVAAIPTGTAQIGIKVAAGALPNTLE